MRSTSAGFAGLTVLVVVAAFVLLRQAPEAGPTHHPADAEVATAPRLPLATDSAADHPTGNAPGLDESLASDASVPVPLGEPAGPVAAVTGRVVDERGAPVAGVRVQLMQEHDDDDEDLFHALAVLAHPSSRCVSGSDGCFRVEEHADGRCVLALAPAGGPAQICSELVVLPAVTVDVGDVLLHEPTSISGSVVDEDRRPIAGAEVLVMDDVSFRVGAMAMADTPEWPLVDGGVTPDEPWVQAFLHELPQSVLTTSDKAGHFGARLVHFTDSDVRVAARAPGYTTEMQAPFPDGFRVVLRRATARLAGRVAFADGSPPPADTFVKARSTQADDVTDPFGRIVRAAPDGRFEITGLLDQPCELQAVAPGHAPTEPLIVEAGTLDALLVLRPRAELRVLVTRDGVPVEDFDVACSSKTHLISSHSGWSWQHAGPRAGGVLLLPDFGGEELTVQAFAGAQCSRAATAGHLDVPTQIEIGLSLEESRVLSGVVVEQDSGRPVPGIRVSAMSDNAPGGVRSATDTDAEGRFRLGPVPRATLVLQIAGSGCDELVMGLNPAAEGPIVIEMTRRALVHVLIGPVLRDELTREKLTPTDSGINVRAVAVDGQRDDVLQELRPAGAFFDGLAPGRYRLALGDTRSQEFTVTAGTLVTVEF